MVPHWAFLRCRGLVCSPAVGRAGRGVWGGGGGGPMCRCLLLLLSLSAQLTTQLHQESPDLCWVRGRWAWGVGRSGRTGTATEIAVRAQRGQR